MTNKEFIQKLTAPFPAVKWVVVSGISKGNATLNKATYSPYISTDMITDRFNSVLAGCYEISTTCSVETISCTLTVYFPEGQVRKFKALGTFNGSLKNENDIMQAKATNALKKAFEYLGYSQCKALGMQEFWHKEHPTLAKLSYKQDQQNAYINKRVMNNPNKYKVPDEIAEEPQKQTASKEDLIKGLPEALQGYISGELFSPEELELLLKNLTSAEKKQDNERREKWVNAFIEKGKTRSIQESEEEPVTENININDMPF